MNVKKQKDYKGNFKKIYSQLNPTQKEAVDTVEGPVMVIAGPGSGKTQVLTARIANILRITDTNPYSILALTFTESAASTMKQRLVKMIGKAGYYVQISTFHSFCLDVIRSYPDYFPLDKGSEPLSDIERYEIMQDLLDNQKVEILKPINTPYFYIKDILSNIATLKREGITPLLFEKIVKEEYKNKPEKKTKLIIERYKRNKAKSKELMKLYANYQKRLSELNRYDFEDMIIFVAEAFFNHKDLLSQYQEKIHYFLVDEYQDTNSSQNTVVNLLASYWGDSANIFVVGDPHQSIYRFQGASTENIVEFINTYKKAKIIILKHGYRSSKQLYKAAYNVISNNTSITTKYIDKKNVSKIDRISSIPLDSSIYIKKPIQIASLPNHTLECTYVAQSIRKLIKNGVNPEDIAVLYRNNADAVLISEVLKQWKIPFRIEGGGDVLKDKTIDQFLTLLTVINQYKKGIEDVELYDLLMCDWVDIDKTTVMSIMRIAGRKKRNLHDFINTGYESVKKILTGNSITHLEFNKLDEYLKKIQKWAKQDSQLVFPFFIQTVLEESGYTQWILCHDNKIEYLSKLNALYAQVKKLTARNHRLNLSSFLQAIDLMRKYNISIQAQQYMFQESAINLSTVHKAKGREWEYVFIIKCVDGKWGNIFSRDLIPLPTGILHYTDLSKLEKNEDERRLFYVAITRAVKNAIITYSDCIETDSYEKNTVPSMFLEEIDSDLCIYLDTSSFLQQSETILAKLIIPHADYFTSSKIKDFFQSVVSEFKLSTTSLDSYIKDPKEFMRDILLRIPKSKPEHMAYGTAVHESLEFLYKYILKHKTLPALKFVLKEYEEALEQELLHSSDFERRLIHGKNIIEKYYNYHPHLNNKTILVERFFGYGYSKTYLGDIPLSGRIDRIDMIDYKNKSVRVIDYKTGKARSVAEIEGKTVRYGSSDREKNLPSSIVGSYKRQLLFYKLLADLDPTFNFIVREGEFDFVEPTNQGNFIKRRFTLNREDIDDLKDLIRQIMDEIRALKFLE